MTAVHYQAHVTGDDFVLYCGSKYAADAITLQILRDVGAKVIATAASTEQLNALTDAGAHIGMRSLLFESAHARLALFAHALPLAQRA
jgi:D-arabinose 1-dehydrogenase-like Zn-dependent alcohol dehydrogenase